jgi:putative tricarboxylic transport membrane protein
MPAVAALSFVAVYAVNSSAFDLVLMTIIGALGYLLRKLRIPLAPVILGLVLGPMMETNLRRALSLSGGDWSVIFSSRLAIALWLLAAAFLFLPPLISRFSLARAARTMSRTD